MEYIKRPWGEYIVLENAPTHKVRRVTVRPGGSLSYHYHQYRRETWVIIQGKAAVMIDGVDRCCVTGEIVEISPDAKHRIQNTQSEDLIFIEVQAGRYFGDDDVLRVTDDNNRNQF